MKVDFKKAFNKKRIIIIIAVFVLIGVMAASNPEVWEFFSKTETVGVNFQVGVDYNMVAYGKDMLLVDNEGIVAFDRNGREAWNIVASATSPHVTVKDKYILLTDIGGKSVKLFNKDKTVTQIQTENEILCAKLNKNGTMAVATNELGYKGMVTLYSRSGEEQFKWHSGAGYIGDLDIAPNGKLALAQLMTNKEEIYSRILLIDPSDDAEPKNVGEYRGIVFKIQFRDNGSFVALSDGGMVGFKKSGKQRFEVDFQGRKPLLCNIDNDNNMVIAFDSGLNSSVLESYSSKGKLRGSFDAKAQVHSLDVCGECIVAAKRDGIAYINPKGVLKKEIKAKKDVKSIKIYSSRDKIMSLGGNSAELIKIK